MVLNRRAAPQQGRGHRGLRTCRSSGSPTLTDGVLLSHGAWLSQGIHATREERPPILPPFRSGRGRQSGRGCRHIKHHDRAFFSCASARLTVYAPFTHRGSEGSTGGDRGPLQLRGESLCSAGRHANRLGCIVGGASVEPICRSGSDASRIGRASCTLGAERGMSHARQMRAACTQRAQLMHGACVRSCVLRTFGVL